MSRDRKYRIWLLTVGFSFVAFAGIALQTSAGPTDDIMSGLADTLDVSDEFAGLILSSGILMSAALTLAVTKTNAMGVLTVLICVMVALIVIGWLPYWVLILVCMFAAGLFGKMFAGWFSGEGTGDKQ